MKEPVNKKGEQITPSQEQLSQVMRVLSQFGGALTTEQGLEAKPFRQVSEQMRSLSLEGEILMGPLIDAVWLCLIGEFKFGEKSEVYGKYVFGGKTFIMNVQELLELNILELFRLKNLSQAEQTKFLEYASGLVLDRVVRHLAKELPEDKKEAFFALFKEEIPDEQKVSFLKENVLALEAIVFEEILAFKEEAVKIANDLKRET